MRAKPLHIDAEISSTSSGARRFTRLACVLSIALAASVCTGQANEISCYKIKRNNEFLWLGIPQSLIPSTSQRFGGDRFDLDLGVDLKDFSPATSVPAVDERVSMPDWSISKYGWNPDLYVTSAQAMPSYLREIQSGRLTEMTADIEGYRRFEVCAECRISIYLPPSNSDIYLIRCYEPVHGERTTGCIVYASYGSSQIQYTIPHFMRQDFHEISSRISELLATFEENGKAICPR